MTENEFYDVVERELSAYLTEIQTSGEPYIANDALWQPHAAAIASAAKQVYLDQNPPPRDPYGVDTGTTLAGRVQQSNTIAGVPTAVNQKLNAALVAGGITAAAAALIVTAPIWSALIAAISANVFLWAAAVGTLAAAIGRGYTHKTWRARHDDKTRLDHRDADGQTVPIGSAFTIGGWFMRYPHDPLGPAEEVINCRCKLTFSRR